MEDPLGGSVARRDCVVDEGVNTTVANPCTYCGHPADTVDHVIPRAWGGTDDTDNLVPACKSCNSRKNVLPLEVWTLSGRERTAWLKERGWTVIGGPSSWHSPEYPDDRSHYTKAAALCHEAYRR